MSSSDFAFCVIPQSLWGISIGNSRILVIASEAKQSLGILNLSLGILEFILGILEFCSLLGWISLAHKFYKGCALNP